VQHRIGVDLDAAEACRAHEHGVGERASGAALCPVRWAATRLPSAAACDDVAYIVCGVRLGDAAGCWSTKMLKA
jgi:hypothetical protein